MTSRERRHGARPQASDGEILALYEQGLSQREIASELNDHGYSYTQQGVAYRLGRILDKEKQTSDRILPLSWKVKMDHTTGWVYQAALAYAKRQQGRGIEAKELAKARALEKKLTKLGAVLTYDREKGFQIRNRKPSDHPGLLA